MNLTLHRQETKSCHLLLLWRVEGQAELLWGHQGQSGPTRGKIQPRGGHQGQSGPTGGKIQPRGRHQGQPGPTGGKIQLEVGTKDNLDLLVRLC